MSSVVTRLRKCDEFGAPLQLNFGGEPSLKTAGGGLASAWLKIMILGYFCMQLVKLTSY